MNSIKLTTYKTKAFKMRKNQTKKEVLKQFKETILHNLPKNDKPCIIEAWNNYTDMLCKDNQISDSQYRNWSNPF